ncbi:hypothetical protein LIER_42197 [Lithospermum erythrorhizon]|uniref:Transposase MuDR plant domain-containing protein n=1 Tax=Lithospermum erythrorhizon TaxID=34254 RepID=A0AAV3RPI9_LITER
MNDVGVRLIASKEVMLLGWYPSDDRVAVEETVEQVVREVDREDVIVGEDDREDVTIGDDDIEVVSQVDREGVIVGEENVGEVEVVEAENVGEDGLWDDIIGDDDNIFREDGDVGNAFMETNNIAFDDFESEAFTRKDNFDEDYEPHEDAEIEDDDEIEQSACYLNEDEVDDDIGPILNYIKTIPAEFWEVSDELLELSGDEDEEQDQGCSSAKRKNTKTGLQYNKEVHLRHLILIPNMVFDSAAEFRELVRHYALQTKKPLKFVKNDKWRVRVKCTMEGV